MQKVSSFFSPSSMYYQEDYCTATTNSGQTCKDIFELQLCTFCFVKKMYVE